MYFDGYEFINEATNTIPHISLSAINIIIYWKMRICTEVAHFFPKIWTPNSTVTVLVMLYVLETLVKLKTAQ